MEKEKKVVAREEYAKPELVTHEPLRNITAFVSVGCETIVKGCH